MMIARLAAPVLARPLEKVAGTLLAAEPGIDFASPAGEAGLVGPDSVSWRVFRNPLSMYVGGVAAVLLELGEPRVRAGVWDHSSFKRDPARRLRRTGLAAMITVYSGRTRLEATAARVRAMHARVAGTTDAGVPYRADDPELLRWVQATAAFSFLEAFQRYVRPVTPADRDLYYAEGAAGSALYGATDVPASQAEMNTLLAAMLPSMEPSPVLEELLAILRTAAILPAALRPMQSVIVRAAVDLLPEAFRDRLRLRRHGRLSPPEAAMLRLAGGTLDRAHFESAPSAKACVRLGLPADYLVPR